MTGVRLATPMASRPSSHVTCSTCSACITVVDADVRLELHEGEETRVEISTKSRIPSITAELAAAGFTTRQLWTDTPGDVALLLASVDR